ncbi:MAG: hypothetical protein H6738_02560 [Alphaproteobacteria bacterium]|nr:hypothetical protein [Alphaproteobacteria bacterium]MCB9695651.1 hypothetical protein [Alphaproteobacteria bacterium]
MQDQPGAAFGVAGNFTGHLEQAGEASDFVAVRAGAGKPKGMFPIYLAGTEGRLSVWPMSSDELRLPPTDESVQPEPELALRCRLSYDEGGVVAVAPDAFAAFDDTSIRRPNAPKISHKKNWGPGSKGLAATWIPLDRFTADGVLAHHRLACFLVRDGRCEPYGEDSAVADYGTMYGELTTWMTDRLRHQEDHGPLEHLAGCLDRAGRPEHVVITIGATRYTAFGESTFVQAGDEVVVVVYDARRSTPAAVAEAIAAGASSIDGASVLRRRAI